MKNKPPEKSRPRAFRHSMSGRILPYDAENRWVQVKKNGSILATFTYACPERRRRDGDGNGGTAFPLVKATVNGVTTAFIGAHFEWTGSPSTMTKSYVVYPFISFRAGSESMRRAGIPRIALRTGDSVNTNLKWLLGDHLGSTSVTADYAGTLISRTLYKPLHSIQGRLWGEVRYQSGALPTKYTYTGQYSHTSDFGLMYYVARWYDPVLGRFAQADSLVPGAGQPRAWDRYAGMMNNPIRYSDPSGHLVCSDAHVAEGDCSDEGAGLWRFGVTLQGQWSEAYKKAVRAALMAVGNKFAEEIGSTAWDAFKEVYREVTITMGTDGASDECKGITGGGCTSTGHQINFASLADPTTPSGTKDPAEAFIEARNNVVHELGHAFALLFYNKDGSYPDNGPYKSIPSSLQNELGFHPSPEGADLTWRQHPGDTGSHEIFADMFLGYTFSQWDTTSVQGGVIGRQRDVFMTTNMAEWIR